MLMLTEATGIRNDNWDDWESAMTIGMIGIRNAGSLASARSVDRPGLFRDDLQRSMTPGIASYYNNIAQNGAFSQVWFHEESHQ